MTGFEIDSQGYVAWFMGVTITLVFAISTGMAVSEAVQDYRESVSCKARVIELEKALKQYQEHKCSQ